MALSALYAGRTRAQSHAALYNESINEVIVGWWCQRLQICGSAVSEVMDDIWYLHMSGWSLLLHKPRCLQISPLLL